MNVGQTIQELPPKIKAYIQGTPGDLLAGLLFVVVTFLAFGLGRLSALTESVPQVAFVGAAVDAVGAGDNATVQATAPSAQSPGAIVASKKGTKYHFPWCPGATAMNESNKIWFASEAEARAAGYTPASNCKGLQ
jgi:hypothetical protein